MFFASKKRYLNEEFTMAYNLARYGYKWSKYPPGYEPNQQDEKPQP
jgi:hypothetical protein